jgi:hypothetical protein
MPRQTIRKQGIVPTNPNPGGAPLFKRSGSTPINLITVLLLLVLGCAGSPDQREPPGARSTTAAEKRFLQQTRGQVLDRRLRSASISDGFALLVGVADTNVRHENFEVLRYSAMEVERMRACLHACGYRVKTLVNEDATYDNIIHWLKFFAGLHGRHKLLFYYSGHGTIYGEVILDGKPVHGIDTRLTPDAWDCIEKRLIESIYAPLGAPPPSRPWPPTVSERVNRSFFLLPFQSPRDGDPGPFNKFQKLVGYDEIAAILAKSGAAEKIVIIDACSAGLPKAPIFTPLPHYSYDLQRQGFTFLTLISADEELKIREGQFTPVVASGLGGEADHVGDNDKIITTFELIRYANAQWRSLMGPYGMRWNQMNHMIFGSADIPLTVSRERSLR